MNKLPSLDELWETAPKEGATFPPAHLRTLPEPARRYLEHAIVPGTALASAVQLRMHGEFRLKKDWCPFTAEQVIRWDGEMLWRATMRLHGLPITGFDSVLDGKGEMQWKLFGLFPVASGEGPDVTRSALGRVEGESMWLPSLLCGEEIAWTASDEHHVEATLSMQDETTQLHLTIGDTGRLEQVLYKRWGNPESGAFHYADFGGFAEEEGTFDGYTIPTRLRVGWYFGSDRFKTEGEFFRVTIDHAAYR